MARQYRVVDHIVEHLAAAGVTHFFGVDGANIEDLYDAAYFRSDFTAVLAKHEFSAATMATPSRSGLRGPMFPARTCTPTTCVPRCGC